MHKYRYCLCSLHSNLLHCLTEVISIMSVDTLQIHLYIYNYTYRVYVVQYKDKWCSIHLYSMTESPLRHLVLSLRERVLKVPKEMFLTYKYVFLFCCGTERHGKEKKRKNKFSFSTPLRVFFSESKEEEQENIDALFGRETLTFHITSY